MASRRISALRARRVPQQERSEATLGALLEAAERIARAEGVAALTMARLAEVSGFSAGTMYRYFRTKEALLLELEERSWREHAVVVGARIEQLRDTAVDAACRELVELMVDRVAATITLYGSVLLADMPAAIADQRRQTQATIIDLLAAYLGGVAELRHADARTAAIVALNATTALARVGAQQHPDLLATGEWSRHVGDLVVRYLFRS